MVRRGIAKAAGCLNAPPKTEAAAVTNPKPAKSEFLLLKKQADAAYLSANNNQEFNMAKGNNSHKKETKKPKKEKPKAPPAGTRRSS